MPISRVKDFLENELENLDNFSYKIDNDEVWKDVKEGKVLGFSIEALVEFNEIKLNIGTTFEHIQNFISEIVNNFNFIFINSFVGHSCKFIKYIFIVFR